MSEDTNNIFELNQKIEDLCMSQIQERDYYFAEKVKQLLPLIKDFASYIFERKNIITDDKTYQLLVSMLSEILTDIVYGIEREDEVLLMDALWNGMREILSMFQAESEETENE